MIGMTFILLYLSFFPPPPRLGLFLEVIVSMKAMVFVMPSARALGTLPGKH